ncbi:hypothetical protein BDZ94DRAFT_1353808 [Collybia nuda]|uniref:Uncharacterized protein n=1 Tax=Collybia nuda TaxID=64659 RepID=A0A9P5Y909_9AGAR|nr:hypothetical protein BDZ94DRAFT_1353808 [Collybia nuda]
MSSDHPFLFASLDSHKPLTTRKVHIRRLYDVLQLAIHRNDLTRANRAWCILARCKEIHWMTLWTIGLHLLSTGVEEGDIKQLGYLRTMMLRHQEDRECILKELVLRLIMLGKYREAQDELELYLPSFPYSDNPVLHLYAGLISLYMAQPTPPSTTFNSILLREAQSHFEHTTMLDPDNVVAGAFLDKVSTLHHPTSLQLITYLH